MFKGTGTRDYHDLKLIRLDWPESVEPSDESLNFFNCPFNILFIFEIFKHGTQMAFEFHLSLQNLREHQLVGSFFLLAKSICGFFIPFILLFD